MEIDAFIVFVLLIGIIPSVLFIGAHWKWECEDRKLRKKERIRYFVSVVTDRYYINRPYVLKEELDREGITKSEIKEVINSGIVSSPTIHVLQNYLIEKS